MFLDWGLDSSFFGYSMVWFYSLPFSPWPNLSISICFPCQSSETPLNCVHMLRIYRDSRQRKKGTLVKKIRIEFGSISFGVSGYCQNVPPFSLRDIFPFQYHSSKYLPTVTPPFSQTLGFFSLSRSFIHSFTFSTIFLCYHVHKK